MNSFLKIFSGFLLFFLVVVSVHKETRPKVYDCILFFNEPELLEIRLNELCGVVDKFVIVESLEDFQGKKKPLNYLSYQSAFKKFSDKIIYVITREQLKSNDPWIRKIFQRNQIMRGLACCKDHDIIMISDMDEIVNPSSVKEIKRALLSKGEKAVTSVQKKYCYFLNRFEGLSYGTVSTTYAHLKTTTPQAIRNAKSSFYPVENGGWHFSRLGGVERVVDQLTASTEGKRSSVKSSFPEYYLEQMDRGVFEKIDDTFPAYIKKNEAVFREKKCIR